MTDPAPRTAVIVDDHAIFRSGLRADLDPDRLAILGEAGDCLLYTSDAADE